MRRDGADDAVPTLGRRQLMGAGAGAAGAAGLLGVSSLVLPGASAAASEVAVALSTDALVLHLDASTPGSTPSTTWLDLSGAGNTGSVATGVTFVAAAGDQPAHYRFPATATGAVVTAGGGGAVVPGTPPTAYTKMVWFRRDANNRYDNLLSSTGDSAYDTHFLYFSASATPSYRRLTVGHASTSFTRLIGGIDVGAATWTFGAATFSTSSGFAVYTNTDDRGWGSGTIMTSPYGAQDALTKPLSLRIGGIGGAGTSYMLQGDVATAVMHARALTEAEVRAYYAATVDRFHPV